MSYGGWPKYVPVAKRKANALKKVNALRKKGENIQPIEISGRAIAKTFWGKAWCKHLEKFSDYENRLPRGRTYVRNGSVCHLAISEGKVEALVSGSEMYRINIIIKPLPKDKWELIKKNCATGVSSMLELLQGKLSEQVMQAVTDTDGGMFPLPSEISLDCNCPDWAELCKHLAAVLYGVGARLDESPELLFKLRKVDHQDLISSDMSLPDINSSDTLVTGDLANIFGIDFDDTPAQLPVEPVARKKVIKKRIGAKAKKSEVKKEPADIDYTGADLVAFRENHSMTQKELADISGKSLSTIQRWESAKGVLKLQQSSVVALKSIFA